MVQAKAVFFLQLQRLRTLQNRRIESENVLHYVCKLEPHSHPRVELPVEFCHFALLSLRFLSLSVFLCVDVAASG